MWIVETCIRGDIMVQVLYKLCDMWITYLTGIDWQQATVLYKLCDMWIKKESKPSEFVACVLYKLCDMWIIL